MQTAYATERPSPYRAAADPIGDIGHIFPTQHDIKRPPKPPLIRRPPKKKPDDKQPRKPADPAHNVDDYA